MYVCTCHLPLRILYLWSKFLTNAYLQVALLQCLFPIHTNCNGRTLEFTYTFPTSISWFHIEILPQKWDNLGLSLHSPAMADSHSKGARWALFRPCFVHLGFVHSSFVHLGFVCSGFIHSGFVHSDFWVTWRLSDVCLMKYKGFSTNYNYCSFICTNMLLTRLYVDWSVTGCPYVHVCLSHNAVHGV